MGDHSYGHGQFCHYCGVDGDKDDDKPCDESLNKKATPAELAAMEERAAIAKELENIAFEFEMTIIETLDDAVAAVHAWAEKHKNASCLARAMLADDAPRTGADGKESG